MSSRDADDDLDRDVSGTALSKLEYPSDDEIPQEKMSPAEYKVGLDNDEGEESAPSSFRLRLATAQLTDSLSVADHEDVDMIAEKVRLSPTTKFDFAISHLFLWHRPQKITIPF